ncbi:tail assembly chaperone [Sporosarcina sp. ITBMC105]
MTLKFTIKGETHDLKLNFEGIKHLNLIHEGGSYEVIGKALMGDLETFTHVIDAALRHTGNPYTLEEIEKAIDEAVDSELISLKEVLRMSHKIVAEHSFYKDTVDKLLAADENARTTLEQLLAE